MICIKDVSDSTLGFICVWALTIYILCAWNFLNSFRQNRKKYIMLSGVLLFIIYIVIQTVIDIKFMHEGKGHTMVGIVMGQLPVIMWVIYITMCMSASIILTVYYVHWRKEHITVMSIKDSIDMLQAGLCYWKEGGQVILSNRKMDEICNDITGEALLNGEQFYEKINVECIEMSDGSIRSFKHRVMNYNEEQIHELVATDVTELYKKNKMYVEDTKHLRKMNENLRRYNHDIEEMVRMQEILQAKMYIHDEMNKLMLLTSAKTDTSVNDGEFESIMTVWRNNALLLGNEATTKSADEDIASINELANMLAINIKQRGDSVSHLSKSNRKIFIIASREAIANAVKHAAAKEIIIDIRKNDEMVKITIINDGNIPEVEIKEGGGLSNIRRMAEDAGGKLEVLAVEDFRMILSLPQ